MLRPSAAAFTFPAISAVPVALHVPVTNKHRSQRRLLPERT